MFVVGVGVVVCCLLFVVCWFLLLFIVVCCCLLVFVAVSAGVGVDVSVGVGVVMVLFFLVSLVGVVVFTRGSNGCCCLFGVWLLFVCLLCLVVAVCKQPSHKHDNTQ